MTDDATLSDFLSTGEADETAAGSDEEASAANDGEASDSAATPSTMADEDRREAAARPSSPGDTGLSTYAWGRYACDRCDTETDRVWREDGALVCPECKSW